MKYSGNKTQIKTGMGQTVPWCKSSYTINEMFVKISFLVTEASLAMNWWLLVHPPSTCIAGKSTRASFGFHSFSITVLTHYAIPMTVQLSLKTGTVW